MDEINLKMGLNRPKNSSTLCGSITRKNSYKKVRKLSRTRLDVSFCTLWNKLAIIIHWLPRATQTRIRKKDKGKLKIGQEHATKGWQKKKARGEP